MAVVNDAIFYDRSRLVGKSVGNSRFFPDHFGRSEMPAFLVVKVSHTEGFIDATHSSLVEVVKFQKSYLWFWCQVNKLRIR